MKGPCRVGHAEFSFLKESFDNSKPLALPRSNNKSRTAFRGNYIRSYPKPMVDDLTSWKKTQSPRSPAAYSFAFNKVGVSVRRSNEKMCDPLVFESRCDHSGPNNHQEKPNPSGISDSLLVGSPHHWSMSRWIAVEASPTSFWRNRGIATKDPLWDLEILWKMKAIGTMVFRQVDEMPFSLDNPNRRI